MADFDYWGYIHSERASLSDDLSSLPDEKWSSGSLCGEWSVADVLAHMTGTAKITPLNFFPKLAGSGFNFNKLQASDIAAMKGSGPADTLSNFASVRTSTKRPPGPKPTMLGETIIHSEDIRRPLGINHSYNTGAVAMVADFYKNSNLIIGAKKRIAGVTLKATDTDWSHGTGPEASGPIVAILMAMTGRKAALSDLSGDGVAVLQQRV